MCPIDGGLYILLGDFQPPQLFANGMSLLSPNRGRDDTTALDLTSRYSAAPRLDMTAVGKVIRRFDVSLTSMSGLRERSNLYCIVLPSGIHPAAQRPAPAILTLL